MDVFAVVPALAGPRRRALTNGNEPCEAPLAPRDSDFRGNDDSCGALCIAQFRDWSTSLFFLIHGIIERSLAPTCSIECSAVSRRRDNSVGAPARFSRMKSFAYSPLWMRARASRIACLVAVVTIFGPVTYSPYSALFEI